MLRSAWSSSLYYEAIYGKCLKFFFLLHSFPLEVIEMSIIHLTQSVNTVTESL